MNEMNFYMPYKVEFLFDFFSDFEIKLNEPYTLEKKNKVLKFIRILLENKIIYAGSYIDNKTFKKWDSPINKIIEDIFLNWKENLDYSDFYNIVLFRYESWYIEALKREGYNDLVDWNWFIEEKIGDLKKWIEKNRP